MQTASEKEIAKQAISSFSKRIQEQGKARRDLKAKTIIFYREYITEGKSDEEARALILERLESSGLTERKLKTYVENPADISNPKAMVLSEAKVMVWLERQTKDIDEIREEVNEKLLELSTLDPDSMITMERVGDNLKQKPVWAVTQDLLERKANALDRFFTSIKNLRGNQTIINIDNRAGFTGTIEDLDEELEKLEQLRRVPTNATITP